jgi:hypothetical protein
MLVRGVKRPPSWFEPKAEVDSAPSPGAFDARRVPKAFGGQLGQVWEEDGALRARWMSLKQEVRRVGVVTEH